MAVFVYRGRAAGELVNGQLEADDRLTAVAQLRAQGVVATQIQEQKAKAVRPKKIGGAKDKDLATMGERIYRGGTAARQIAACASCHSPNGAGIPAQYPRVSGQHSDYTASQLVAFRDGVRKNSPQMAQIAAKLNDREIRAVADYIAGLR